ncbi:hypothetical protein [Baekduia sp.]|uniref:hypothetical protein n=1 Tax=Baekduia sp. TaxID=2600305 RepID=UPI002E08EDA4|nr:hypothetical protein [Baekduia sp.]
MRQRRRPLSHDARLQRRVRRASDAELLQLLIDSVDGVDLSLRAALLVLEPDEVVRLAQDARQAAAAVSDQLDAELRRRAPNVRMIDQYRTP